MNVTTRTVLAALLVAAPAAAQFRNIGSPEPDRVPSPGSFSPEIRGWIRAPGAADRFDPSYTAPHSRNRFLSANLAAVAYPFNVGLEVFWDTAAEREDYENRVTSLLTHPTGGWGYDRVTFFRNATTDTEGFIASNEDYSIVSFRGSESLPNLTTFAKDWIGSDLNMPPVSYAGGQVQQGFKASADSIYSTMRFQLLVHHGHGGSAGSTKPIWFTGHSLGGALAVLSAHRLKTDTSVSMNVKGAYTIGQPMVGNLGFANSFRDTGMVLHRTVYGRDFLACAFGELHTLPSEISAIRNNMTSFLLQNSSSSISISLPNAILNGLDQMFGISDFLSSGVTVSDLQNSQLFGYRHFGSIYFLRRHSGAQSWGYQYTYDPSISTRYSHRIAEYSSDFAQILSGYVLPEPPTSALNIPGWTNWSLQVANIAYRFSHHLGSLLSTGLRIAQQGLDDDHHPFNYLRKMRVLMSISSLTNMPEMAPVY